MDVPDRPANGGRRDQIEEHDARRVALPHLRARFEDLQAEIDESGVRGVVLEREAADCSNTDRMDVGVQIGTETSGKMCLPSLLAGTLACGH